MKKTNNPIHVAHLVARLPVAGLERVVVSLIKGMPSCRYASSLWCLEEADILGRELEAEGWNVVEVGRRRRRDILLFLRLAALVRKNHINILHCHDELSWFYGAIGGRLGGISTTIFTMHGRRSDFSIRHLMEQKLLAHLSSKIVSVSEGLKQQLVHELGISSAKVSVIHNGISSQSFQFQSDRRDRIRGTLGISANTILVGSVGRLQLVKNIDLIIEAVALVLPAFPNIKVAVIGDGPLRNHLTRKVSGLGLDGKVLFLGRRNDISEILSAIDIYVCSSDREGISLSILEAMAAERAVIATAVGGNPEIIQNSKTGLLIRQGDVAALAAAIIALSNEPEKRLLLGRQAKRAIEAKFSMQRMLAEYNDLYLSNLDPVK